MNLIQLDQRSFDRNNNSTLGENISRSFHFNGLQPVYPTKIVKIQSKTWHRDSHGLFDFESNSLKKQLLMSKGTFYIQRNESDETNILPPKGTSIKQREESLATVIYSQGKYFVYHANDIDVSTQQLNQTSHNHEEMTQVILDLTKKVYLVVKNQVLKNKNAIKESQRFDDFDETKGIVMRVGDIVKFGRVPFRIKESSIQKNINRLESQQNLDNSLEKNITDVESEGDNQDINQVINDMIMTQAKQDSPRRRVIIPPIHDAMNIDHQESDFMYASPRQADFLQESMDDPYRMASFQNRESNFHDMGGNSQFSQNEFLAPQLFMSKKNSNFEQLASIPDDEDKILALNKNSKLQKMPMAKSCRICLGEENEVDNELICPCKCSGTMKFIHLKCLQEWLNGKKSVRELPFSTIYLYKISQCELCKTTYPDFVKDNKKKIEIFKINRPTEGQYLIMEVLGMPNGKTFQIIRLSERHTLKVGRGHDSDVRVADISVSRCHSLLRYDQDSNQIILTDYHSKFGTLLLLKKPLQLSEYENTELMIQTGRTMLTLSLQDIQAPIVNKICSCLVSKQKKEQFFKRQLHNEFEYYQCADYLPKDLVKRKKELFGDLLSKIISPQQSKHETRRDEIGPGDEEMNHYFSEITQHNPGLSKSNLSVQKHQGKMNQIAPLMAFTNGNLENGMINNPYGSARQNNRERSVSVRVNQSNENNQVNLNLARIGAGTVNQISNSRPQSNTLQQHLQSNNVTPPQYSQPQIDFRIRVNDAHQQSATPSNPQNNNIREEIKEEEEEKLMDEICKEQEEKDKAIGGQSRQIHLNQIGDSSLRDNPNQFEQTSNIMNRTQQAATRQQMGTVNAQEEQEQIGFQ